MKALSFGFVFDTEAKGTVLVAKHEQKEHGNLSVYRTENDRYFSHFQPSKEAIEDGEIEMLTYLQDGVEELDELIEELNDNFTNKVEVYLEHFPIG